MSDKLKARVPRGFVDRSAAEIRGVDAMLAKIRDVYERYGFEPVETPLIEYTDALGKFLPDQDRPNEGVFSFQDDDEQWLSLRYDLTAPLARYVAENFDRLAKPYRSFRAGWVFRNEKPGPGRYRQFMQFDADTVGSSSIAADAENAMMFADIMEAVGIARGDYRVRVNNRKVLDGLMEAAGLAGSEQAGVRLSVLRAIDKLDKFGPEGVRLLLGPGRRDESGDFTKGAGLNAEQIAVLEGYITASATADPAELQALRPIFANATVGLTGLDELASLLAQVNAAGYGADRIVVDPSVVRGLEYYTGPVYEAELTFETVNEAGEPARFGSVGGGGRYDGLVGRFRADDVPATGISIGVSRLAAALRALGRMEGERRLGPVVVLVLDRDQPSSYQALVGRLRAEGISAEMYLGDAGMKAQMKYADRRSAPCVVIQGSDERERGSVQIKDLIEGAKAAAAIKSNQEWREGRPAQIECSVEEMAARVKEILARHM